MKTVLYFIVIISALCVGLLVKAQTAAPSTQPAPINKMCAIETKNAIDPTVTVMYKGKVIGFCCKDCIPEFQKDPEKYMKDLK